MTNGHSSRSSEMRSALRNNKLYSSCKHVQTLKYDKKKNKFILAQPSSMSTMEPTPNPGKQVSKMTEHAKAAHDEQSNGPKKRKNDEGGSNVLKKGRSNPESDCNENTAEEMSTSSQGPKRSRQATVKEVPDDDDRFISQWSYDDNESRTTQEASSSQPHAKDKPGML